MNPFLRLIGRSVVEDDRLSPRLLTVFAFVLAALWLIYHGATTPAKVENGIILTAWPPEYIWSGLCLIIAGLLGLGKVVNAFTKVKMEGPAPVPDTVVQADVNVNQTPESHAS